MDFRLQEGTRMSAAAKDDVERNKDVARRFIAGIPVTDPNETAVRSTMAENAIWKFEISGTYTPQLNPWRTRAWDREKMIRMHLNFRKAIREPYKLALTSLVAEGDKVVAEAIGSGVSVLSGRTYEQHYCFHLTLKDGLIVEGKVYQDTLHIYDVWIRPEQDGFFSAA
jgi:ketosteroid isomerase-like protein